MSDDSQRQLAHELKTELRHFTGDSDRFRNGLNRHMIYTPGIRYLADRADAYWLIDAVARHLTSEKFCRAIQDEPRIQDLHIWKLVVSDNDSAVLTAQADSNGPAFITQEIVFTDFPLSEIDLWVGFDGQYFTL